LDKYKYIIMVIKYIYNNLSVFANL